MRVTKKDIYKSYGIEFQDNRIKAPFFGWIPTLLVNGNEKIGKGVYHFSTLPTNKEYHVTCNGKEYDIKGTCPCHCDGCYATKGNYNYSDVQAALAIRTLLARLYPNFVERAIIAQIKADKIEYCRIHASGDFDSIEYVEMWKDIVSECKGTKFWTYTKVKYAECAFNGFTNCNVVKSIVPECGYNFGHCDYIIATYYELLKRGKSVYICRCGIDKNQHCNTCKGCSANEYVLFVEHSTAYKAEKDPAYTVLKELIESQKKPE